MRAAQPTHSAIHQSEKKERKIHYYRQSLLRVLSPNYAAHGELLSRPLFTSDVCGALEKSVVSTFPRKDYFQLPPPFCAALCSFMPQLLLPKKISANYPIDSVYMYVCVHAFGLILFWALCSNLEKQHTKEHVYLLVAHGKISPGYAREVAKL